MNMIIGVDFDNTIVCYDHIFKRLAIENDLLPSHIEKNKVNIRNYLRAIGKENDWTALQGTVYGACMFEAILYPGVKDFFLNAEKYGVSIYIISHKTRHPFIGPKYDLHMVARQWLKQQSLEANAYFEENIANKLNRISALGCTHFIDDLPEIFLDPKFPPNTKKILFNSQCDADRQAGTICMKMQSWIDIDNYFFK